MPETIGWDVDIPSGSLDDEMPAGEHGREEVRDVIEAFADGAGVALTWDENNQVLEFSTP